MEKVILKWVTGCSGFLTIVACVSLYLFPSIKENMVVEPSLNLMPEMMAQVEIEIQPELNPVVGDTQADDTQVSGTQADDTQADDAHADDTQANASQVGSQKPEQSVEQKEELNIELPDGLDGSNVTITNDYLTQTVWIRFDEGVDNYSEYYRVYGSSNHISSLSYYKDGEAGVLEIKLDQVCELSYRYREDFLCLEFVDPHDIYDKVIVVDAGHGGRAPGAVKKDVYEKNLNLAIVKEIKALFDEIDDNSVKVYYTRLTDTNPTLAQRVGLANEVNADLFISIHNNSSASGKFNERQGTMVLYSQSDTSEYSSKRFAEICIQNVNETTGSKRRGLAQGDYIHIVRNSEVPVALIEVGYMTNLEELAKLQTAEYQKLVAQGVYNAVMQAFEEGY